jgi:ubiquinone/menaquinone biosynthesis C-methylase UbiE
MTENWEPRHNNYTGTAANVQMRWAAYERYSEPPFDFEAVLHEKMGVKAHEAIVDIGCGFGSFLFNMKNRFRHSGPLVGIDPNAAQFDQAKINPEMQDMDLREGWAQDIPLSDNVAHIVTSLFAFYEIPQSEQPVAIHEILRILKEEGRAAFGTSGAENKLKQRDYEALIADYLNIEPPRRMNQDFTSERADIFLPQYFKNVVRISHHADMVFKNLDELNIYLGSIYSMQDQFNPIPPASELLRAINETVRGSIEEELRLTGAFRDKIRRDFYLCSNVDLPVMLDDPDVVWLAAA